MCGSVGILNENDGVVFRSPEVIEPVARLFRGEDLLGDGQENLSHKWDRQGRRVAPGAKAHIFFASNVGAEAPTP